jgi:hypothetical protein
MGLFGADRRVLSGLRQGPARGQAEHSWLGEQRKQTARRVDARASCSTRRESSTREPTLGRPRRPGMHPRRGSRGCRARRCPRRLRDTRGQCQARGKVP